MNQGQEQPDIPSSNGPVEEVLGGVAKKGRNGGGGQIREENHSTKFEMASSFDNSIDHSLYLSKSQMQKSILQNKINQFYSQDSRTQEVVETRSRIARSGVKGNSDFKMAFENMYPVSPSRK